MSEIGMKAFSWKTLLTQRLPLLGHRNWIAVVDAAYPWQNAPGVETVVTGSDHLAVLKEVFSVVGRASHIRPSVRIDAELSALSEAAAPGIGSLRKKMERLFDGGAVTAMPHEKIIGRLDAAARLFHVLVFKTTLTLPYTSVFFELDCGYWSEKSEHALRTTLSKKS